GAPVVRHRSRRVGGGARAEAGGRALGARCAETARAGPGRGMTTELAAARPLAGCVILVTRAREQADRFATLLQQAGARVLVAPTIAIEPPESWAPLDEALARSHEYQWAIFTSVNGVEMVRRRLERVGRGAEALRSCRIAAIGPATADALRAWGVS